MTILEDKDYIGIPPDFKDYETLTAPVSISCSRVDDLIFGGLTVLVCLVSEKMMLAILAVIIFLPLSIWQRSQAFYVENDRIVYRNLLFRRDIPLDTIESITVELTWGRVNLFYKVNDLCPKVT